MGEQRQIKSQQTRKMNLHFENAMYRIPFEKSGATLAIHLELSEKRTLTNANWVTSDKLKQKSKFQDCFHYKVAKGAA